jgi:aldose sugar dehydrogenase
VIWRTTGIVMALSLVAGCGSNASHNAEARASLRPPVQTAPANAPGQTPAFPEQARAPQPATPTAFSVQEIASGLVNPWAIEVLADGRMLVTERPGRLRVVLQDGTKLDPIEGIPNVFAQGQGGLLDVAVRAESGGGYKVCVSYAEPQAGGQNNTAVACGNAIGDRTLTMSDMRTVWRQQPSYESRLHFGSRIVFRPEGGMFVTTGERSLASLRGYSQDIGKTLGKVVRLNDDGSAASGNPFFDRGGPAAEVWSYGHRNLQSAAIDPRTGKLWTVEHGPRGGDELNQPEAGKNYGWPIITYGIEYRGGPVGEGLTRAEGMEQPVYYWDPVIAPSGMLFYTGDLFPGLRNKALIGGLVAQSLVALEIEDGKVTTEEWLPLEARVRDVAQGPDGAIYVVTDDRDGRILKLTPSS